MKRFSTLLCVCLSVCLSLAPAVRAQDEVRPRLVAQLGHSADVTSLAVSPDGRQLLSGSHDKSARLWDLTTGKELQRFEGHTDSVLSVAFSPDGKRVLTGSRDGSARLWNAFTGEQIRRFTRRKREILAVAYSPDGTQILTGAEDKTARLWDIESGKDVRAFEGHYELVSAVAFSKDGARIVTGSWDRTARLWDLETGNELGRFGDHVGLVTSVAIAPDGASVLTGSRAGVARLWNTENGQEIRRLLGHKSGVTSVAFSADGSTLLTGGLDGAVQRWEAATGKGVLRVKLGTPEVYAVAFAGETVVAGGDGPNIRRFAANGNSMMLFEGRSDPVWTVGISPNGRFVHTTAQVWDAGSGLGVHRFAGEGATAFFADGSHVVRADGNAAVVYATNGWKEVRRLEGHTGEVEAVAVSADGQWIATGSRDKTARLWNAATGAEERQLTGHGGWIRSVAFSPDGTLVVTAGEDKTARIWEAASGGQKHLLGGHGGGVAAASFSPDGLLVATASEDGTARLWTAETGEEARQLTGHTGAVSSVAFSPAGDTVATGGWDKTARLWDVATGGEIGVLEGHTGVVWSVAYGVNGTRLLTGSWDRTALLWDAKSGKRLAELVSFRDATWAVADPEGRYDAAYGGQLEGLHWVVGMVPVALDQLRDRYYDPGLLSKLTGNNSEAPRDVNAFRRPQLHPEVKLRSPTTGTPTLGIQLYNRGGGIGRVVVRINGKEFTSDARTAGTDAEAKDLRLQVDLDGDPRLKPGEKNEIEVQAFSGDGTVSSRRMTVDFIAAGKTEDRPPRVFALAVGVSDYAGDALDLRYAAQDAEDFKNALRGAGGLVHGQDRMEVALLASRDATSAAVRSALENMRGAAARDKFVLYLAGHVVLDGEDFRFLTSEARSEGDRSAGLSGDEISQLLRAIPALHQAIVIDACGGVAFRGDPDKRGFVPSAFARALDRMSQRTNAEVLGGYAEDRLAYQANGYGQALLTRALLEGMRTTGLAAKDNVISTRGIFMHARQRVPEWGGLLPTSAAPKGNEGFVLGKVTADVQMMMRTPQPRPLVLDWTSFQDEEQLWDTLKLTPAATAALRAIPGMGREAPLLLVTAKDFPAAYRLAGRYKTTNGETTVEVHVFKDNKREATFRVTGKPDATELANKIAETAKKNIRLN